VDHGGQAVLQDFSVLVSFSYYLGVFREQPSGEESIFRDNKAFMLGQL
jgi:hypothetical protein